jgi:hypothetical protein
MLTGLIVHNPVAMRPARQVIALGLTVVGAAAWGCGAHPSEGQRGVGTVGGGGGTELLDAGSTSSGNGSGESSGLSGSSGSRSGNVTTGSGGSTTGSASGNSGAESGSGGATGSSGSAASSSTDGGAADASDAGDAGTGGFVLTIPPGPVHLVFLSWTIAGPHTYQGSVEFGDAQSFEWVVGGILAAHGYTLSVLATDAAGDPCRGTSSPFDVAPGMSTYTMITITCDAASPDPADVTTGSVVVEAGVVSASD